MGPEGKRPEDARLEALLAHRQAVETAPQPAEDEPLMKSLLPLVIAQGLDFLSTEKPLGFNRRDDWSEVANKFPGARASGFAGTAGRTANNLLELVVAALLAKKSPRLARAYIAPAASTKIEYAKRNWQGLEESDMHDRSRGR